MSGRSPKQKKTFEQLGFKEQAQAINMAGLQLRKKINAHLTRARQEGRDVERTRALRIGLVDRIIEQLRTESGPAPHNPAAAGIAPVHARGHTVVLNGCSSRNYQVRIDDHERIGPCLRIAVEDAIEVMKGGEVIAVSEVVAPEMMDQEIWLQLGLVDGFRVFVVHYM